MGRRSFPGGIISSTEPSVTGYGASGMWTTQTAAQKKNSGAWPIRGITPSGPVVGPTIANVSVTDSNYTVLNDTPYINSAGGYIKISGTGFASGAVVYVGGSAAVTTSFISSTEIRAQVAAGATSNSFPVYVVNTDSSVAIKLAAVTYSGLPSWSTAATLGDQVVDSAFSISLSATGDSAITYSLAAGSSLPPGTALSSGGVFSGTVTGLSVDTAYSFSVVANDAENQDSSRTFTVNVSIGDQYFNITPLLLNGEANVWIRDSSVNNAAITIAGDTRPVAFSPYNSNWSAFFDGTGDYLSVSNGASQFGTSDFAIEFWIYFTTLGQPQILDARASGTDAMWFVYLASADSKLYYGSNNTTRITSDSAMVVNRWYHVVISRVSTITRMFINGTVQTTTYTDSANYTNAAALLVGQYGGGGGNLSGYLSNLRILIGSGYTSVTVPTAPLTAIANTRLLTLHTSRFVDGSTNAYTITRFGDTAVRSFAPFNDTDTTTGSGYFDGTGDYISLADNDAWDFGNGNFTVEAWFYATAAPTNGGLITQISSTGAATTSSFGLYYSSGSPYFICSLQGVGTYSTIVSSTAASVNVWHHTAAVRNGTTITLYLNGLSVGTLNVSTTAFVQSTASLALGRSGDFNGDYFTGYISNARVVKGSALYTANFTPPTAPLTVIANTQLLTLQYRTGDNNHRFVEESGIRALTTRAGNAHQGSFSPFSPAGWSGYFDGSTSYLNASIGTLSGTWTVEFWVNMPTLGVQYTFTNFNIGSTAGINIWRNASNQLVVDDGANAQTPFSTVTFATAGVWYHVAVTRDGTTTRGYINGVLAGTNTFTPTSVNAVTIGRYNSPTAYLLGYMSNLRIVDGVVVYTGAFTPPTAALTATQGSGTNIAAITAAQALLLTLQNNRFVDNSTTPKTLTRTGSLFIQAFSPFRPSGAYNPVTHGGSVYLDGSGDYVYVTTSPAMTLGTNNHCIEFWMYPNGTQAQYSVPWYYDGGIVYYFSVGSNSSEAFLLVGGGSPWSLAITILNAEYVKILNNWTHVAITRTGTAFRVIFNGRLVGYGTTAQSIAAPNPTFSIGWDLVNATTLYKGWLSNFRIINGSVPAAYQTASTTLGTTIFTPPTSVPAFEANTVMVMNFTNGGIVDASGRHTFETVGDAKISNVQSKFGLGSLYFDGTGDYLKGQVLPQYAFGTGDFTFECWIYMNSYNATSGSQLFGGHVFGVSADYIWFIDSTGKIGLQITSSTSGRIISTSSVPLTTWTHIAVVRSNGTITPYINGTNAGGSAIYATTMPITTVPTIGSDSTGNTGFSLNGYIDDLRISRFARYTANFTVPAQAFLTK
jgi:hypothetical protein